MIELLAVIAIIGILVGGAHAVRGVWHRPSAALPPWRQALVGLVVVLVVAGALLLYASAAEVLTRL